MSTTRRFSFILIFNFYCISSMAQTASYESLPKDVAREKTLLEGLKSRYNKDVSNLEAGSNKKLFTEVYKDRYEYIKEMFTGNEIITEPKTYNYLKSLVDEIISANPQLQKEELRVVFSEAWWPNASSMGEGTLIFHIGLFHRLENEAQAAFVLCHELAHYYLDHGNTNIRQYVQWLYSEEMQKNLKTIQKSEYRQNEQLENLAKKLSFKYHRHSRELERSADSVALEFMKHSNFDLNDALSCLGLLDSVDRDKYASPLELDKRFDFPSFHFKKKWIESDAMVFTSEKEKNDAEADSLKTHPDCSIRIKNLEESVIKYNTPGRKKFLVNEAYFKELKTRFDYEILNFTFEQKMIGKSLFYTLEMLNRFPDNPWLHIHVGKCLNEIYTKQKSHELGKIVDRPSPERDEAYNELLQMIQNLRLYEIAAISYNYLQQHQTLCEKEAGFAAVWAKSQENFNNSQ